MPWIYSLLKHKTFLYFEENHRGLTAYLEKEMATHSSMLAWEIPWTEEPDRLQSMGSPRVGYNWANTHVLWCTESFINVLSFTVASDGDLNISAFPTLGAQKHSCLNSSTPHLPITVSVGFPSSMHLWKLPHKMLFLYPCWAQLELTSEPS